MHQSLVESEPYVRLAAFAFVLAAMAAWEMLRPRRRLQLDRATRWPSNLAIVVIDAVFVRLLLPLGAVGLAMTCEERGWGLFNVWLVPTWLSIVITFALLDLVIYLQHVLFHAVPVLWRLHRMHHADLDFDVTTGSRFHPIEILLSMVIKLTVIAALGAPPVAVLLFEVVLNATAMFNHANVRIPSRVDAALRLFVVTPDMHRVHHSVLPAEANANFGFNLPWWDRMFGTYRAQPEAGHEQMTIGVKDMRDVAEQRLDRMLTQPFRGDARSGLLPGGRDDG